MLESYFKYPGVLRRMRRGPLAEDIDALAEDFARIGYARATVRRYLSLVASFSRYADRAGHTRPEALDMALVERFLSRIPESAGTRSVARTALGHAVRRAARGDRIASSLVPSDDPDARMLTAYGTYLRDVRGLQPRSCQGILLLARRLLQWYRARRPHSSLSDMGGEDILAFVAHLAATSVTDATRSSAVSHVRGLLRYLHGRGVLLAVTSNRGIPDSPTAG